MFALSNLGFDNYVEPLQNYLKKYREVFQMYFHILSFLAKFTRLDKPTDKDINNTLVSQNVTTDLPDECELQRKIFQFV